MPLPKIAIIVGRLRIKSRTRKVAAAMAWVAPDPAAGRVH
jgi:NAD(P)H-dependent FMN reductase